MDAWPAPAGASTTAGVFVERLRCLPRDEFAAVVCRLRATRATVADDLDRCRATVAVSVQLRRLHRSRAAAIAARQACEAVVGAAGATGVARASVVHAARSASDVARSLVAGGPRSALAVLGRGWEDVVGACTPPSHPTAA